MSDGRYTQGFCEDGAAILYDGQPITVDEVVGRLNSIDELTAERDRLEAKLATLQGGLQSICDTHGYAVPKPVLNNLLAALEEDNDE